MNDAIFSQIDFGPLKEFLEEDNITDISYSNGGQVWLKTLDKGVYRVDRPEINNALMENETLTKEQIESLVETGKINPDIEDIVSEMCFETFYCEGVVLAEETYKDLEMVSTTEGTLRVFIKDAKSPEQISDIVSGMYAGRCRG